ncbi:MAG: hypothetical protein WD711_05260 [Dongiaceae bacterium]
MNLAGFRRSLADEVPPRGHPPPLVALWYGGKGNWDKAHRIVQDENGSDAAWVHAWLHRVEGDPSNARYWYGHAGKPEPANTTDAEWAEIATALLESKA